jgi:hypothetical protein
MLRVPASGFAVSFLQPFSPSCSSSPYTDYREDHLPSNEGAVSEDVLERSRSLGYLP